VAPALVVVAVDGEPLVQTGRVAAARHARQLVGAARARRPARLLVAVGRAADDARAALAPLLGAGELLLVPEVIGCDGAGFLAAYAGAPAPELELVHAADLVAGAATRLLTVAGAVAAPGVLEVPVAATVEDVVAAAGGARCGPAWVALASSLRPGPPLERDAAVGSLPGLRALLVAPGASTLARRARGDLRALDVSSPLGVDRAWLGAFDPNAAAAAPLSLELCARRLGFDPGSLAWPGLDLDGGTS
jgi:hypothetical protein